MRSLRPPPKVTPPKPPAHLFEPRESVAPVPFRLEKQPEKPAVTYEDDVKFQMQQLEEEMRMLLEQEKELKRPAGPSGAHPSAAVFGGNRTGAPHSFPSHAAGSDLFASRVNPLDWRKNGYPSEFAYMKAMGQMEISNGPPARVQSLPAQVPKPIGEPQLEQRDSYAVQNRSRAEPGREVEQRYERDMTSPARRKGGAIQNLYNDDENLRRKFASQHQYSDLLHQQVCVRGY
jgi:hypothetical protein